jgi:hypothetical protein
MRAPAGNDLHHYNDYNDYNDDSPLPDPEPPARKPFSQGVTYTPITSTTTATTHHRFALASSHLLLRLRRCRLLLLLWEAR